MSARAAIIGVGLLGAAIVFGGDQLSRTNEANDHGDRIKKELAAKGFQVVGVEVEKPAAFWQHDKVNAYIGATLVAGTCHVTISNHPQQNETFHLTLRELSGPIADLPASTAGANIVYDAQAPDPTDPSHMLGSKSAQSPESLTGFLQITGRCGGPPENIVT